MTSRLIFRPTPVAMFQHPAGARDKAEVIFSAKAEERVKRALDETSAACDAIERLRKERDEARSEVTLLKSWKESAMQVFAKWDKVGQEALRGLQPRLGSSIAEESAKAIRAMRDENARLREAVQLLLARIDAEAARKQTAPVPRAEPEAGARPGV